MSEGAHTTIIAPPVRHHADAISFGGYLADFMVPTLTGNTLGGVSLVAALNHAQVASGKK